ncbi:hypothetical protein [Micromonospora sp. NBC_01796]|uniref:hypothetical protein n=1 Tax=Micromonospora sp. NBC_01796 TaxID=2975987 RepID=UPI002DDA40CA|nr:hypothetical protein [Micromonospora sp. NBC_01796]WSA84313.1 hypothetical protein OIE47_28725 [Micromonospora sp. NBC_01796]
MAEDITQQPLARAVLSTLARNRGKDDPLGSLARTVLTGEAGLRAAAAHSWHGQALGDAFTESLTRQGDLTATERAEIELQARELQDADTDATAHPGHTDTVPSEAAEDAKP